MVAVIVPLCQHQPLDHELEQCGMTLLILISLLAS